VNLERVQSSLRLLAFGQGALYLLSGVWPVVHLRSFLAVTGPKIDLWLVQTMGALLAVLGAALIGAARRPRVEPEWVFLGAGAALVLGGSDAVFVQRGVISRIYLVDAAGEFLLAAAWIAGAAARRRARSNRLSKPTDAFR
jgi:hypothetical protein